MRRIAIVGSGITGLVAAHGLLKAGYAVTVYSDRTADEWLNTSRPTGTAARFDLALSYERELGLNFWDDVSPFGEGVYLTFCPALHNPLITLLGRFQRPFQAVDVRLQSARWMVELERRGGELVIGRIAPEDLETLAAKHDLVIIAAGRADLCQMFARDGERSVYDSPQRQLAMVIAAGGPPRLAGVPMLPVRFDFLGTDGEIFFAPYYHKDVGASWNILVEAKSGSRLDRFRDLKTGESVLAAVKAAVSELFPWDEPFVRNMHLADPLGWLTGAVVPTIRRPSAALPSGKAIAALGDTAISYDPIAAQGANSGVKQARDLVNRVVARGTEAFDRHWIDETFELFYNSHAQHAYQFSNLLLEPITAPGRELLIAQYGSDGRADNDSGRQKIANAFVENFNDPRLLTSAFTDMPEARAVISGNTGGRWLWNGIRGRAAVAKNQLRVQFISPGDRVARSYTPSP
jgi:2-polyprenyl-6-methoxyphenol hydroxylase-like FAD-dependent oxidoreductase